MTPARPHARTRIPRPFISRPVTSRPSTSRPSTSRPSTSRRHLPWPFTTRPVTTATPASRWRSTSRLLAVVAATFASALLVGVAPASAHDQLVGSQPADGETVTVAPEAIVLSFSADVADLSTEVVLRGPSGDLSIDTGSGIVIEGATVTAPLPAGLPDGAYTVAWRVVSGDGHPIQGQLAFTIALPPTAQPTPPADTSTGTAAPTPTATSTLTATAAAPADDPASSPSSDGGPRPGWVAALVGIGLVGTATALVVRRRRAQP